MHLITFNARFDLSIKYSICDFQDSRLSNTIPSNLHELLKMIRLPWMLKFSDAGSIILLVKTIPVVLSTFITKPHALHHSDMISRSLCRCFTICAILFPDLQIVQSSAKKASDVNLLRVGKSLTIIKNNKGLKALP